MRSFVAIALLFTTVAACGGHLDTDPNPDSGKQCPSTMGACSDNGATCSIQMNACGHPTSEQCTCMNGSWACPIYECPKDVCPPYPVGQGEACSTSGMGCSSNIITDCSDVTVTCYCDGSEFQCPIPDCPPPLCPPPDQIVAGQACNGPGNMLCTNGDGSSCFCQGTWQCEGIVIDGGVPDASNSD